MTAPQRSIRLTKPLGIRTGDSVDARRGRHTTAVSFASCSCGIADATRSSIRHHPST